MNNILLCLTTNQAFSEYSAEKKSWAMRQLIWK